MRIHSALDDIYAERLNPDWEWYNNERAKKPIPDGPLYHGTTVPNLTHILPANQSGSQYFHGDETNKDYTYATPDLEDAWGYAESGQGAPGRPRVYEVEPLGGRESLEHDPPYDETGRYRWNNEDDLRTSRGFKVIREIPAPSHIRKNYSDEEWNRWGDQEKKNANPLSV